MPISASGAARLDIGQTWTAAQTFSGASTGVVLTGAAGADTVFPSITTVGADVNIPLALHGKGPQGYVQLGPDTYGITSWQSPSYDLSAELVNFDASEEYAHALYMEVTATSISNSKIRSLYAGAYSGGVLPQDYLIANYAFVSNYASTANYISAYEGEISSADALAALAYGLKLSFTGPSITTAYGLYVGDLVGRATNPYFLWYNGIGTNAGVWRINQFGIRAYYNPTFADYTPGATDFERIVEQWESNVAVTRTEAGGTGTLRSYKIAGQDVILDPTGDVQITKALVALGGGASATLGTIGGSGPATAGQNTWLRLKDSTGAAFWVPAWK